MPKIFRIIVPVADIEVAQRFYSAILGSAGRRVSPGRHYFDCEGVVLACYDSQADGDDYTCAPNPEPIYLTVADLSHCGRSACYPSLVP